DSKRDYPRIWKENRYGDRDSVLQTGRRAESVYGRSSVSNFYGCGIGREKWYRSGRTGKQKMEKLPDCLSYQLSDLCYGNLSYCSYFFCFKGTVPGQDR